MDKFLDKYRVHIGVTLVIIILAGGLILVLEKNNIAKLKTTEPTGNEELTNKIDELEEKIKTLEDNQQKIAGATDSSSEDTSNKEKSDKININTADQKTLESLPGIGEKRALDIISYRESNGGFKNISEIKNIKGIGDSIYNQIKDQITI